jgi:hypothetical protein
MQLESIPQAVEGFQVEKLDDEIILLHPLRNIIIYSNESAALIWQLCDGLRSVETIIEILSAAYPEARDEICAEVPATLQTLIKQGALEVV